MADVYETIIIGGGIAGITASIYASRQELNYLFISKDIGGQISIAGEIENYPGFKHTDQIKFMEALQEQLDYNKIKLEDGVEVSKIEKKNRNFIVKTNEGNFTGKTVIIATGATHRKLNVPGEKEFANKGVHYCSWCDGPLYKGKEIAVIGGGNSALEAADFLANVAKKVYLVTINKDLHGEMVLIKKVNAKKNIELIPLAATKEIKGKQFVDSVSYEQNKKEKSLKVDGVFVAIGMVPSTAFLKGFVKLDEDGHVVIDKFNKTSVDGVFAAGDCTDLHEYQFAICTGGGCMALLQAAKYMQRKLH